MKQLKVLAISFGIISMATLVLGEICVRLLSPQGYITPRILRGESLEYEPAVFARHYFPLKEQSVVNTAQFNRATHFINSKGYRGRDFSAGKPLGTIRIMVYGGSSVFDLALPEEQDWPRKVEKILRSKGFQQVEVINAGIPGHASFDSFSRLWTEGHHFSPDYVILYGAWNDIKQFQYDTPLLRQFKPYVPEDNPFLNYRNGLDEFLGERSQLYVRLRNRYYKWRLDVGYEGAVPKTPKELPILPSALKQFRLNWELFVDLARDIGATPILMTEARLLRQENTDEEKKRLAYAYTYFPHAYIYDSFTKTDEIISFVAAQKEAKLIDASKLLGGVEEDFVDHVHLSPKGSDKLAQIVAENLIEIISKTK